MGQPPQYFSTQMPPQHAGETSSPVGQAGRAGEPRAEGEAGRRCQANEMGACAHERSRGRKSSRCRQTSRRSSRAGPGSRRRPYRHHKSAPRRPSAWLRLGQPCWWIGVHGAVRPRKTLRSSPLRVVPRAPFRPSRTGSSACPSRSNVALYDRLTRLRRTAAWRGTRRLRTQSPFACRPSDLSSCQNPHVAI